MSIDLSQFHQVFFEESFEGLDVMESSLMELDPENVDNEVINSIFRAAHSIKGGSATFGFTSIAEFTHVLETLLDQIRAGKRSISPSDVNLFLQSVDCMKEMLQLLQSGEDGQTEFATELEEKFTQLLNNEPDSSGSAELSSMGDADISDVEASEQRWHVAFEPGPEILKTGNEPIRLFCELSELGEIEVIPTFKQLAELTNLDVELIYIGWDIYIKGSCTREEIEEVFEWISDESVIAISREDVLSVIDHLQSTEVWDITFEPLEEIFQSGNDPLKILKSLNTVGDVNAKVNISKLPPLASLNPENCFLSWELNVSGESATFEAISQEFEWVTDVAHVEVKRSIQDEGVEKTQKHVVNENERDSAITELELEKAQNTQSEQKNNTEKQVAPSSAPAKRDTADSPKLKAKKPAAEASSIRVGIDKVDSLINMVGELVITQSMLGQIGTDFEIEKVPTLIEGLSQLEHNTRELQESVMRIRMLPISFAFSRFPRMVRDLSQSLNKKIDLEMLGEQTELDKTVMEKIGDPLVHLVRNAVDHGIEEPHIRLENGKPEFGQITLNAYHQSGNVCIEIEDDGKGLDAEKLKAKAVEKGLISDNDARQFSDEQIYDLIFQPGFSTAKAVTDVSGRGVGMDVVRRNIQALNGSIDIDSALGKGSKITIRLPLTLAILDGQLVRVGDDTYVFPLTSIVESIQCKSELVRRVANGCDVFKLRDEYVPIVKLSSAFSVRSDYEDSDNALVVVVEIDGEKVGIVVDELLAQQQVVIKSIEQNYQRVTGISGATILGDGRVALIIDIPGVVNLSGEKLLQVHNTTNHNYNLSHSSMTVS